MKKIKFSLVVALMVTAWVANAQGAITDIPKTIDYHDARITNVGVVGADVYEWVVKDSLTSKMDTVFTADEFILWESDGDIQKQVEAREKVSSRRKAEGITVKEQKGSLKNAWLANFYYRVFTYEYPSVDADGNKVMLSSIAACPVSYGCSQVRDIVIGTHITICANKEAPSKCTSGWKESDWGVMFSFAGGKKFSLGPATHGLLLGVGALITPVLETWVGLTIAAEVKSAEPSSNYNLVIMPDYEGYGTTSGRAHPYLYQELTARQVVDGVRYGKALYENASETKNFRHPIRSDFRSITCGYS